MWVHVKRIWVLNEAVARRIMYFLKYHLKIHFLNVQVQTNVQGLLSDASSSTFSINVSILLANSSIPASRRSACFNCRSFFTFARTPSTVVRSIRWWYKKSMQSCIKIYLQKWILGELEDIIQGFQYTNILNE